MNDTGPSVAAVAVQSPTGPLPKVVFMCSESDFHLGSVVFFLYAFSLMLALCNIH